MGSSGREQLQMMGFNVTARDPTMDARTVHSVNVNNKKVRVEHGQMTRFIENAQDVSKHTFRQEEKELIRQIERLQKDKQSLHHIASHSSNKCQQGKHQGKINTYAVRDDNNQAMYVTVTGRAERDASKISVHSDATHFHNGSSHHAAVQQPVGYGHTVKEWAHEMGIEQKSKKGFHGRHTADRRTSGSYIGARRDSAHHTLGAHSSSQRFEPASHRSIRQQTRNPSTSNLTKTSRRTSEQSVTEHSNSTENRRWVSMGGKHVVEIGTKTSQKVKTSETASSNKPTPGHAKMLSEPTLSADNHGTDKEKGKSRRSVPAQQPKSSTKKTQNKRLTKSLHHVKTKHASTDEEDQEPSPPNEGATHRRGSVMPSKADNGNRKQLHQGQIIKPGHHLQLSRDTLEEIHSIVDRGQGSFLPPSLGSLSRKQQQRLLALQMQSQRLPSRQQEPADFNAFETLQSRYLRLSDSNVKTLIDICNDEGIEVGIHPHMDIDDVGKIVFAEDDSEEK